MGFKKAIRTVFSKSFQISGRSPRSEYWYFNLFINLVALLMGFLMGIFNQIVEFNEIVEVVVLAILALAMGVPVFMCLIRRLHDIGLSGWWASVPLIVLVGMESLDFLPPNHPLLSCAPFILLVMGCLTFYWLIKKGDWGENQYGPDPLDCRDDAPTNISSVE